MFEFSHALVVVAAECRRAGGRKRAAINVEESGDVLQARSDSTEINRKSAENQSKISRKSAENQPKISRKSRTID